jgi:hypothetical protein
VFDDSFRSGASRAGTTGDSAEGAGGTSSVMTVIVAENG